MPDFFDFLPDFSGLSDAFSGVDGFFSDLGSSLSAQLPDMAKQLSQFAINQFLMPALGGSAGGKFAGSLIKQLPGTLFGGGKSTSLPEGISSDGFGGGTYFQASQGQSMAQLAAMISRAGRRFL